MRMFKKDEGFTLVELMVVVLIIGILVAVAIPVFNAASGTARERTCQANMRTIEGAVEQYLAADAGNLRSACDGSGWSTVLVGAANYIKSEPLCPTADAAYTYDATDGGATDTTYMQAICGNAADDGGPHDHF